MVFYYDIKLKYISVNLLAIIVLYQNMFFESMMDAENVPSSIEGMKGPAALARSKKAIRAASVMEILFFVVIMAFAVWSSDDGFYAMLLTPLASIFLVLSLVNIILLPKYNDIDECGGLIPYEIISSEDGPILVQIVKRVDVKREDFQEMNWVRVILEEPAVNKKMSLALLLAIPSVTILVALSIALLFSAEYFIAVFALLPIFMVMFLYNYIKMCKILKGDVIGGTYLAFCRPSGNFVYMDVPLEMLRRKQKKSKKGAAKL